MQSEQGSLATTMVKIDSEALRDVVLANAHCGMHKQIRIAKLLSSAAYVVTQPGVIAAELCLARIQPHRSPVTTSPLTTSCSRRCHATMPTRERIM